MKTTLFKTIFFLVIFITGTQNVKGADTLSCSVSMNFYKDLSDTYGNDGSLFLGDFSLSKSWYGLNMSYGFYQAQSTSMFQILIEEIDETFEIPIEEMAIMKIGSVSGILRPIKKKWIEVDFLIGVAYGKAKNSSFKSVDYIYNIDESKITYLSRDYQLIEKDHFGYQVGFNISFFITKKFGLQLNSRIQDLSNGGTFFFVGSGIIFRL